MQTDALTAESWFAINALPTVKLAAALLLKIQPNAATAFIVNIPKELQMFPENVQKIKLNANQIRIARNLMGIASMENVFQRFAAMRFARTEKPPQKDAMHRQEFNAHLQLQAHARRTAIH